jgi:replication factor A2
MSDVHKTVLTAIKNVKGGEGVALDDVLRTLKSVPNDQVRAAIEYLSSEGHIYSTIDENHFRASGGM